MCQNFAVLDCVEGLSLSQLSRMGAKRVKSYWKKLL